MKTTILITLVVLSSCTTTKETVKEQVKTKYNEETILTNKENNKQTERAYEQIKTGIADNTETIVIETHYSPPDSNSGSQYKVSETRIFRRNNVKSQINVNKTEIRDNTSSKNGQEVKKKDIKSTLNTERKEKSTKNFIQKIGIYLAVAVSLMLIFAFRRVQR